MNVKAAFAILMVYIGCGLNNVFLEYIIKLDPGAGHLITFSQFVFIALQGYIFTSKFGTTKRMLPASAYLILVVLFFITSVLNNWAFDFNIPVPLHMIFRSGSLITSMILGIIILKKKYSLLKILSIIMITIGIAICTLISSSRNQVCSDCDLAGGKPVQEEEDFLFWWIVGILILTSALFLSAFLGIYQESMYAKYGKHPQEALYYSHLYSLPMFVLYAPSIGSHSMSALNSESYLLPVINAAVPILVLYLLLNVLTQFVCISAVYTLTSECSSLTFTLVITLRKFFSLLFSIVYFKNPFTLGHWFGTTLVFVGTLIFTEVPDKILQATRSKEKLKTK